MMKGDSQYFAQTPKLDLIQKQLDSDSQSNKLEALKRLIAMISKGKDASPLFPYVVKNVLSSSMEIKKLVYMYLIHYAESKPDEALLSISAFQRDMADKNQFIRASALRVLSSIRVPTIVPVLMIAIRKCGADSSPFVRKVAAIAVPKVYSMNEDEKDQLIGVVEPLLGDNNTTVLGAAAFAFTEVCPERGELLHKHFRKLCRLMPECDEWGQVLLLNALLRYGRTQFLSPFREGYRKKVPFYGSDEEGRSSRSSAARESEEEPEVTEYDMDPDHRLLLRSAVPLLQSRNSAVVLAVCSLYFHLAPAEEFGTVVKALMRIVRSGREAQFVILTNVSAMTVERPQCFQSYLKDFFVSTTDPSFIRELKLNILAQLTTSANVPTILKEFKTYIKYSDKQFVRNTIRAIGKVASNIPDVADACMADLLLLLNSKQEEVVAESVIVIRHLLQKHARKHPKIIRKLAALLETVKVPVARASIVWLIGEFYTVVPTLAPDVFRKMAKSFREEAEVVKLQILTLGIKLHLAEIEEPQVRTRVDEIFQFVLQLARYDLSYDVRDRTRMVRNLLFSELPGEAGALLKAKVRDVLLCAKPPPEFSTKPQDRSRFQLGSMSHIVNHTAFGYTPLADFPTVQPDPSVRGGQVGQERRGPTAGSDRWSDYSSSSSWSGSRSRSRSGSLSGDRSYSSRSGSQEGSRSWSRSRSRSQSRSRSPPRRRSPRRREDHSPSASSRSVSGSRSPSRSPSRSRSRSPPR
eukprot:RCo045893